MEVVCPWMVALHTPKSTITVPTEWHQSTVFVLWLLGTLTIRNGLPLNVYYSVLHIVLSSFQQDSYGGDVDLFYSLSGLDGCGLFYVRYVMVGLVTSSSIGATSWLLHLSLGLRRGWFGYFIFHSGYVMVTSSSIGATSWFLYLSRQVGSGHSHRYATPFGPCMYNNNWSPACKWIIITRVHTNGACI